MRTRLLGMTILLACLVWPNGVAAGEPHRPANRAASSAERADTHAPPAGPGGERPESAAIPEYRYALAEEDRSVLWDGVRMTLSLAVVLAVLAVGVKLIRRWPGVGARDTAAGSLQMVGRLALGAKEAICLIRTGSDILVVGVCPAGITLLHRQEGGSAQHAHPEIARPAGYPGSGGNRVSGGRFRDLAARLREVHATWRIPSVDPRGDR